MGNLGTFGASGNYVNYGTLTGYDDTGVKSADYTANRYGFGLGWGREILKGLSAGVAVRGATQSVSDNNYSNLSADLGALWTPVRDLKLGLAYSNLGTAIAGYSQASALRLGGSYCLDPARTNHLLLAVAGAFEPQGVSRLQVGAEDVLYSMLALRLGYQASLADNQIDGLTGLTMGAGFMLKGFTLDYAFLPYGDLGYAHRISLSYQFGQEEKAR
jgi:hypothetical protein